MSPTPATFSSPVAPAGYTWEATDEEVSARYGIRLDQVARFDLNTSPAPPDLAIRLLAGHAFDRPISEYPPSDYRRLSEAAAARYGVTRDQVLVGAGADEILDLIAKAFLPAGGAAVIPTPSYAMYRVDTEQRGADVRAIPRLDASQGYAMDGPAVRAAARGANVVWLCNPNNPTGLPEPDGAIETLLEGLISDAAEAAVEPPIVVLDEAYAEFVGRSEVGLLTAYPRLIVIRTASKAYALAGLRVGFALAHPDVIAKLAPYRPPGSVAVPSVHIVTEALLDDGILAENLDPGRGRTRAPQRGFDQPRLDRPTVRHELRPRRLRDRHTSSRGCRGPARERPRAAHVRGGTPARALPAAHDPECCRERSPARRRRRHRP